MDYWRMLHLLLRRKWVIVAAGLLTAVAAVGAHFLMGSFYQASVLLLPSEAALHSPTSLSPSMQPPDGGAASRRARLDSLVLLARDPALAVRVANVLRAEGMQLSDEQLLRQVSVHAVGADSNQSTAIIYLDVQGEEPEHVRAIADRWAAEFIRNYQRMVAEGTSQTVDFLRRQRDDALKTLERAEDDIIRFRSAHGFIAMDEEKGRAVNAWATRRAEWQSTLASLADVGANLAWVEARLARTPPTVTDLEQTDEGTLAQHLKNQINQEEMRLAMELATKTEEHWDVKPIRQRLDHLKARLAEEEGKMQVTRKVQPNPEYRRLQAERGRLEQEKATLEARRRRQEEAILAERRDIGRFTNSDIALGRLARARQLAEGRYMTFAGKLADAELHRRVIQERSYMSRSPEDRKQLVVKGPIPRAPSPVQLGLVGLLVGLGLGIAAIIGLDILDTSLQTRQDAEALVGVPVASLIPSAQGDVSPKMLPRITALKPTSPHAEAYHFLGTDLLLASEEEPPAGQGSPRPGRVLMIATAKPSQGGTTTIANLAITLAQAGKEVVLVDADMRRPQMHEIFELPSPEPGLADVLTNGKGPVEVLQSTDLQHLRLLPAGAPPENPWQLLKSEKMAEVIATLRGAADFVLIDTPSALVFADALALTRYVDGVIVVIRAREAATGRELQIKHLLNRARAPIVGVVLNDVSREEVDTYRYHQRYYGRLQPARREGGGAAIPSTPEAGTERSLPPHHDDRI